MLIKANQSISTMAGVALVPNQEYLSEDCGLTNEDCERMEKKGFLSIIDAKKKGKGNPKDVVDPPKPKEEKAAPKKKAAK